MVDHESYSMQGIFVALAFIAKCYALSFFLKLIRRRLQMYYQDKSKADRQFYLEVVLSESAGKLHVSADVRGVYLGYIKKDK